MVLVKVQYDAYNRQFKPLDREFLPLLEDGETYMLIADVSIEDLKPASTNISEFVDEDAFIFAT